MLMYSSGQWSAFWAGTAVIAAVAIAVGNRWLDSRRVRTQTVEARAAKSQSFGVSVHRTTAGAEGVQTLRFTLNNRSDVTWLEVTAVVVARPANISGPPFTPELAEVSNELDWTAYPSCALVALPLGRVAAHEITTVSVELCPSGSRDVAGLVEFSHPDGTTYRADIGRMASIKFAKNTR